MPWEETSPMEQRKKLIEALRAGDLPMAEVCRRFGVSRKTGHKWWRRVMELGEAGLDELSRAPHCHPNAVTPEVEQLLLELRKKRPTWGPRKLLASAERAYPRLVLPAPSTLAALLRKQGLSTSRRPRSRATPSLDLVTSDFAAPNSVWCADYKGHFFTGDGLRCNPLTISDGFSRFLIRCEAVRRVDEVSARPVFAHAFAEYGLPDAIRTDNGAPFASVAAAGLSRLAIWWIKLGIALQRIEPGKPTQNGRHERIHRTLKEDTASPPARTHIAQQARFEQFRHDYNQERPHEALANDVPAAHYKPSRRSYPGAEREPEYPTDWDVRRVRGDGSIKWRGETPFISEALCTETIGIEELENGLHAVHFGPVRVGTLQPKRGFQRVLPQPRPGASPK